MPKLQPAALAHDDWRLRGAVYSAAQGHAKALEQLLEMLADRQQRSLTHEDRLALIGRGAKAGESQVKLLPGLGLCATLSRRLGGGTGRSRRLGGGT
jgi:hypothetical protein